MPPVLAHRLVERPRPAHRCLVPLQVRAIVGLWEPCAATHSNTSIGTSTPAQTPAATKTTFNLPSTTPAGPPPGSSLFGGQQAQAGASSGTSSLFGAKPAAPSTSTGSNLFGSAAPTPSGGNALGSFAGFGNKGASTAANTTPSTQPPAQSSGAGLFSGAAKSGTQGTQETPKSTLFGNLGGGNLGSSTPSATPAAKPPLFSLGASSQPSSSTGATPTSGAASSTEAPKPLFPTAGTTPNTTGATNTGGINYPKLGMGNTTSSGANTSTPTTTAGTGNSLFSGIGGGNPPASSAPGGSSLFGGIGGGSTSGGSGPTTIAPASTMFNTGSTSRPPAANTTGSAPAAGASTAASGDATRNGLGNSTAGPPPSAQSRLKNKSMDEIITRWAADLSKYQKEFQQQADTVARWDRALVENSDKVKQLYAKTFTAERDAAEVERQLTNMEENQAELDSYLDRYEKEVENMMRTHGVSGRSDGLRGPDQERERT
jgi:nuclear pore complex protein Nup62